MNLFAANGRPPVHTLSVIAAGRRTDDISDLSDLSDLVADRLDRLARDLDVATDSEQDRRTLVDDRNEAIGALSRLAPKVPADVAAGIYGQIDSIRVGFVTQPDLFPTTLRAWARDWRAFADA